MPSAHARQLVVSRSGQGTDVASGEGGNSRKAHVMDSGLLPLAPRASRDFNEWMLGVLARVAAQVEDCQGDNLVALVLGGAWGRQEGSVIRDGRFERPHLPIDLFPVVRDRDSVSDHDWKPVLARFDVALAHKLRFHAPLTPADIAQLPGLVRWHDLVQGHTVLAGDPNVLVRGASEAARRPPARIEATRLMLDAGVHLVQALRVVRGHEDLPTRDFVREAFHGAVLAMGDALLVAHDRYRIHWARRDDDLDDLAHEVPAVRRLGLVHDYRLSLISLMFPDDCWIVYGTDRLMSKLAERWGEVLLVVERQRAGGQWRSLAEYLAEGALPDDENATPTRWLRRVRDSWRHPPGPMEGPRTPPSRELASALPGVLGLGDAPLADWPAASARVVRSWASSAH
jgi:hypothetical protein